jgi:hypothetical protein
MKCHNVHLMSRKCSNMTACKNIGFAKPDELQNER